MKAIICDLCGKIVPENWVISLETDVKGKKTIKLSIELLHYEDEHICPECYTKISEALQAIDF